MTVAELIAKLSKVNPTLLVCDVDGESGIGADVQVYERTAHVDRSGPFDHPFVDTPSSDWRTELHERVIVITRWGQYDEGTVEL